MTEGAEVSQAPQAAWWNGSVIAFGDARVSLEDRALQLGEGLYEVVALAGGRPHWLQEHAERMRRAAPVLGLGEHIPSPESWHRIAQELAAQDPVHEGMLYLQLTGGACARDHVPVPAPQAAFFAYQRPARLPRASDVEAGVRAILHPDQRWARADLKTTMLLPAVLAKREAVRRGAREALLTSEDGVVHEGASSNLFLVENGGLVTPEQTARLLPGITREIVITLAETSGLSVRRERVTRERLRAADEVFLTATRLLVMPVSNIDERPVGSGRAGPIATDLAARMRSAMGL